MSLSEQDRANVTELLYDWLIQHGLFGHYPPAEEYAQVFVESHLCAPLNHIIARHVAVALADAAERVAEFDWDDDYHADEVETPGYYAAIERARLLLTGQINDWRDRKPQIHN